MGLSPTARAPWGAGAAPAGSALAGRTGGIPVGNGSRALSVVASR